MWATTSSGGVWHLVNEAQDRTLCGLRVTPVVINRPIETPILHLTAIEPVDRELCVDCAAEAEKKRKKPE